MNMKYFSLFFFHSFLVIRLTIHLFLISLLYNFNIRAQSTPNPIFNSIPISISNSFIYLVH